MRMSMIFCPECHTKISSKATVCPVCGYSASIDGAIVPISAAPIEPAPVEILTIGSEVFDDGTSLIPHEESRKLAELLKDAKRVAELAPSIFNAIQQALAERGSVWAADFSSAAEKMMRSGELVLGVEKKTGELLPQLRNAKTGKVYETARLHAEKLPDNFAASIASVQLQLSMAEILSEIKDVAYGVQRLHLEAKGDRIGKAKSIWFQLEQATHIQDGRLREQRILQIAGSATEQRYTLQENFSVQLSLATGKGKAKAKGEAAREALTDLSVISLMARTEYASYCLIGEQQTAMTALKQFENFVADNRLNEEQTLNRLNSISDENLKEITSGFYKIADNVTKQLSSGMAGQKESLPPAKEEG